MHIHTTSLIEKKWYKKNVKISSSHQVGPYIIEIPNSKTIYIEQRTPHIFKISSKDTKSLTGTQLQETFDNFKLLFQTYQCFAVFYNDYYNKWKQIDLSKIKCITNIKILCTECKQSNWYTKKEAELTGNYLQMVSTLDNCEIWAHKNCMHS